MGLQQTRSILILLFHRRPRVIAQQSPKRVSHAALHEIFLDDLIEEATKEVDVRANKA
jgi:hypothetical protein